MASILLVCTGNICRTPMAEGFLREHLRRRFPHQHVDVSSAGVIARDGSPATPEAVEAAWEREVDISGHRARRLFSTSVERSDLCLGMAIEHGTEMRRLVPSASWRIFSLKELLDLLKDLPPVEESDVLDDAALEARIREADALRRQRGVRAMDLDVADPLGMPIETYRATAWELDTLLGQLVEGLVGRLPARTSMWDED